VASEPVEPSSRRSAGPPPLDPAQQRGPTGRSTRWGLIVAAAATFVLIYLLRWVLLPFVAALALAYVASPLVRWLKRRWRFPHWLAGLSVYLIYLLLIASVGLAAWLLVLPQVFSLLGNLQHLVERFIAAILNGRPIAFMGHTYTAQQLAAMLESQIVGLLGRPGQALGALTWAMDIIMGVFLTLVLLAYFIFDSARLSRGLLSLVPPRLRPRARELAMRCDPLIYNYVRGVLVIVTYAAVLTWLVTRLALHLPHAILLAIVVGLLELIPVIGPILSIVIIGLIAVERVTIGEIAGFAAFAVGLRLSIDQLVGPWVLGRAVSLPAPAVIFAFLVGGTLYGMLGVILAVPIAAIIKIVLQTYYEAADRAMSR
jgi:predicted PurR-regulated permease PerM